MRTTVCLDVQEIERLVLGVKAISQPIRAHLLECDRCREYYLALRAIYSAISMYGGNAPAESGSRMSEVRILHLFPLTGANGCSNRRLAAKGGRPNGSVTVFSFTDREQGYVGRLMHDAASGRLQFYLLADDMAKTRGIQIHLPEAGLSGITDAEGRIDFGPMEAPECHEIQIVLPRAVIFLEPLDPFAEKSREQHQFILKDIEDSDIEISVSRDKPGRYILSFRRIDGRPALRELKVVAITDLRTFESPAERGVAVIQTMDPERLLKIHIY
ncbi:MAG: hypothetical protein ONB24_12270 [candidate division KSB1 bacterium]|nr:hypothetical protein [candidate division KSB1 bacterium]